MPDSRKTYGRRKSFGKGTATQLPTQLLWQGQKKMCQEEPLTIIGGTISGFPRETVIQDVQPRHSKESYIVIQKKSRRRLEAKPDTKKAKYLATEETKAVEEEQSRGEKEKQAQWPMTLQTCIWSYRATQSSFKQKLSRLSVKKRANCAVKLSSERFLEMQISKLFFQTVETSRK